MLTTGFIGSVYFVYLLIFSVSRGFTSMSNTLWYATPLWTNVQSNLAKGRIAVSSTSHSPYTLWWPAHVSLKIPPSRGVSGPHLIHDSFWTHVIESAPETAFWSVWGFLYSTPVCPTHRHTGHATCDISSNRPHSCTAYGRFGLKCAVILYYVSATGEGFYASNEKPKTLDIEHRVNVSTR